MLLKRVVRDSISRSRWARLARVADSEIGFAKAEVEKSSMWFTLPEAACARWGCGSGALWRRLRVNGNRFPDWERDTCTLPVHRLSESGFAHAEIEIIQVSKCRNRKSSIWFTLRGAARARWGFG